MTQSSPLISRITVNPKVMLGKPTIRGMRITGQLPLLNHRFRRGLVKAQVD
jgi:uncharacterized protein (DUF433 family)